MKTATELEAERASAKLRFEAAYRVGDCEAEAWAIRELMQIDEQIKEARQQGPAAVRKPKRGRQGQYGSRRIRRYND